MITQEYINEILTSRVLDSYELQSHILLCSKKLNVKSQSYVPINYKGKFLNAFLKIDLIINDLVIVELKAVESMIPLYNAQLLSYLKLTGLPKGLLINFNCQNITKQLIPLVTEEFSKLPKE